VTQRRQNEKCKHAEVEHKWRERKAKVANSAGKQKNAERQATGNADGSKRCIEIVVESKEILHG